MKKMMRMIALLLTVLMVVSALPVVSLADDVPAEDAAIEVTAEEQSVQSEPDEVPAEELVFDEQSLPEPDEVPAGELVFDEQSLPEPVLGSAAAVTADGNDYATIGAAFKALSKSHNVDNPLVITLNEDVTMTNGGAYNTSHYLSVGAVSVTIDLNGHDLSDGTGLNLFYSACGTTGVTCTLKDSAGGGTYHKSGAKSLANFGAASVTKTNALRKQYLVVDGVNIDATGATEQQVTGYTANVDVAFRNVTVTGNSTCFFGFDNNNSTGSGMKENNTTDTASWVFHFENCTFDCSNFTSGIMMIRNRIFENYEITMDFAGTTTFTYNPSGDYGVENGFRLFPKTPGKVSVGTSVALLSNAHTTISAAEPMDKVVLTIGSAASTVTATTASYYVSWDTDGDGVADEGPTKVAYNVSPTHDVPTAPSGKIFTGWTNVATEQTYDVGVALPTPEETSENTLYSAHFTDATGDTADVEFLNYDGSELQASQEFYVYTAPSYLGKMPTRDAVDATTYTFSGWTSDGGVTVYTTLPVIMPAQKDTTITYTAVYAESTSTWLYVASDDTTTRYDTLIDTFNAFKADTGSGTIKLMADYTLTESDIADTADGTYYMNKVKKSITVDLCGHTLTNPLAKRLLQITGPASVLFMSTGAQGTIDARENNHFMYLGPDASGTCDITASVKFENLNIYGSTDTGKSVVISRARHATVAFDNCYVQTAGVPISYSEASNWSKADTNLSVSLSFTNTTMYSRYTAYLFPNKTNKVGYNCDFSVKFGGENKLYYYLFTDAAVATGWGFSVNKVDAASANAINILNSASEHYAVSAIDPTKTVRVTNNTTADKSVHLYGSTDAGGYYCVTAEEVDPVVVSWDTNGDGVVDDTTRVAPGGTPVHVDGVKPYDVAQQAVYVFDGWLKDGVSVNLATETVTESVKYTASFSETSAEFYTVTFKNEDNSAVLYEAQMPKGYPIVYGGPEPKKTASGVKTYEFTGWLKNGEGEPIMDLTGEVITGDTVYKATFIEFVYPFKYIASDSTTAVFDSLIDAYAACAADLGRGVIMLMRDWTLDADDHQGSNHIIYGPTYSVTLDLNGHTLTNDSNRNLFFINKNNVFITVKSDAGVNGKYVQTNKQVSDSTNRCLIAFGTSSASAEDSVFNVGVTLDRVDVEQTTGSTISSYMASPKVVLRNGTYTTGGTFISMQSNKNWTADTVANPTFTLENITFTGFAFSWINHFQNSAMTTAAHSTATVNLVGSNTFRFSNADYKTQNGMQFRVGSAYVSMIAPENGYVNMENLPDISLNGDTPDDGSYYTVTTVSGIAVNWDTDGGDGVVDDVTYVSRNGHPTHDDGVKPYDASQQAVYVFNGWLKNGVPVDLASETITESVTYTAAFSEVKTDFYTVTFKNEDGTSVLYEAQMPKGYPLVYKGATPEKEGVGTTGYEFSGWTKNGTAVDLASETVEGDVTYKASFSTYTRYQITFKDDAGNELQTIYCKSGETPEYSGSTEPILTSDTLILFVGWSDGTTTYTGELPPATMDADYIAVYKQYMVCSNKQIDSGSEYASFTRTLTYDDLKELAKGNKVKATNASGAVEYYEKLTSAVVAEEVAKPYAKRKITLLDDVALTTGENGTSHFLLIPNKNADWGSKNYHDLTFDLNGYTLSMTGEQNMFYVQSKGFTLQNGNIYRKSASRAILTFGTTTGDAATSTNAAWTTTVTIRNVTASSGSNLFVSYLWRNTLIIDHCDFVSEQGGLMHISGTNGATAKVPTDLIWAPHVNVTNSSFDAKTSGQSAFTLTKPALATGAQTDSIKPYVKMSDSVLIVTNLFSESVSKKINDAALAEINFHFLLPVTQTICHDTVGGYYIVRPGYVVSWDTDADGTVDDSVPIDYISGQHPAHADGGKDYSISKREEYTFVGWTDGVNTYPKGVELPTPTGDITYTAMFDTEQVGEDVDVVLGYIATSDGKLHHLEDKDTQAPMSIKSLIQTKKNLASEFVLLSDYTLSDAFTFDSSIADVTLNLGGHTLTAPKGITVWDNVIIKNGTIRSANDPALKVKSGTLHTEALTVYAQEIALMVESGTLHTEALTVYAQKIALDIQGGTEHSLNDGTIIGGMDGAAGTPAVHTSGSATVTVSGTTLATISDAPVLKAEGTSKVKLQSFYAYISDARYRANSPWYEETSAGLVQASTLKIDRDTTVIPGTSYSGYHAVQIKQLTAKVGASYYATLYEAVKATAYGGTVTLLSDPIYEDENNAWQNDSSRSQTHTLYNVSSAIGAVTIDLNGHTVVGAPDLRLFTLAGTNPIVVKNGTLDMTNQSGLMRSGGTFYGILSSANYVCFENVSLTYNKSCFDVAQANGGKTIVLRGGKYTAESDAKPIAVFAFSTNATTGAPVRELGNTVVLSENVEISYPNTDAPFTLCKLVDKTSGTEVPVTDASGNPVTDICVINSAKFTLAGSANVPDTLDCYKLGDETTLKAGTTYEYTLESEKYAATFNGESYLTLERALADAYTAGGGTITLSKNVYETVTATIPSTVKIVLNGHTLIFKADSVINGVTFPNDRQIDPTMNLKRVSLTVKNPVMMNLKFERAGLKLTLNNEKLTSTSKTYSFAVNPATTYVLWATDDVHYGIPEQVSLSKFASKATGALQNLANALYNPTLVATPDAYTSAVAGSLSESNLTLSYSGTKTVSSMTYQDIYGVTHTAASGSVTLSSYANVLAPITIKFTDNTTEEDTLMNALKKDGKEDLAKVGVYAKQTLKP